MTSPIAFRPSRAPIRRQRGVILLAFFIVLFLAAAGAIITVLDNSTLTQQRSSETMVALRQAKEALIAYATLYADNYSATNAGPGYLPCPDTNGSNAENAPCGANSLGRLPTTIILPSGSNFSLSEFNNDIDEQFWYSVDNNFRRNPLGVLNSSTGSTITLDGQGGIAAVILAPGDITGSQARPSNASDRYLEASNTNAPTFVSSDAVDPTNFNDRVLTITTDEIMTPVTRRVADIIKRELDVFHVANSRYPTDQAEFIANIAPAEAWVAANAWLGNSNYVRVNDDQASLTFTGCANISYTVNFAPPDSPDDLRRVGSQC